MILTNPLFSVHAWKLENGQLVAINLFSNSHLPKLDEDSKSDPTLYIGSYQQQLYIQESDAQLKRVVDNSPGELIHPKLNWRPYLISADSRTTVINHGSKPKNNELPMLTYDPNVAGKSL